MQIMEQRHGRTCIAPHGAVVYIDAIFGEVTNNKEKTITHRKLTVANGTTTAAPFYLLLFAKDTHF